MSTSLAEEILSKRFATTKLREGYDMSDVDDFLDSLVLAVKDGGDVAALVDGARFASTKFREGYDMTEVDDYLDEIKGRVAASPAATPADGTSAATTAGATATQPAARPSGTSGTDLPSPTLPAGTGGLLDWFKRRR